MYFSTLSWSKSQIVHIYVSHMRQEMRGEKSDIAAKMRVILKSYVIICKTTDQSEHSPQSSSHSACRLATARSGPAHSVCHHSVDDSTC